MTLTIELPAEQQAALAAKAEARRISPEEYALQVLTHDLGRPETQLPVWEWIVENMKGAPPEDIAALPKDGASQIDHYVYGVPKRPL